MSIVQKPKPKDQKMVSFLSFRRLFLLLVISSEVRYSIAFFVSPFELYKSRSSYESPKISSITSIATDRKTIYHSTNMFWPSSLGIEEDYKNDDGIDNESEDELSPVLDSILKIHCTHSEPDYLTPWQRVHQSTSTSSGFAISIPGDIGRRVMTNAHSVEYGSIVQVQRRGDEYKYEAEVEAIANECDLALLKVKSDKFWKDLNPLEFGSLPALQDEVKVLGYPTGGDSLSITKGVVSRIEMQEYSQASTHLLAMQIDAAINAGNSGGPVINESMQIVGVAFQGLDEAENIGYVVPVTVVQHFLQNIELHNGRYTGFCSLGVVFSLLENKNFRKSLGMLKDSDDEQNVGISGVMVRSVSPTAPCKGTLYPGDVILSVDGIPVANDGKIPFRPGERVSLMCYIQTKFLGDSVKMQIFRERKMIELDVLVGIVKPLVRTHWNNEPPTYLVVSGLVFTSLSIPYLTDSDAWSEYISDDISHLLLQRNQPLEKDSDEVVVLAQVLAHRENLGFDQLTDLHLLKLNDQKIRSLCHLKQIIDECKTEFLHFEFAPDGRIVILKRSSVEHVTREVCEEHYIREPYVLRDLGTKDDNLNTNARGHEIFSKKSPSIASGL